MKVRLLGITLKPGAGISLEEFFDHLGTIDGAEEYRGLNRHLFVGFRDGLHIGLLVTVKDQKRFVRIQWEGDDLTASAQEVEAGTEIADINFFAVHPDTGRGVYQHYKGSCGIQTFLALMRYRYGGLRHGRIEEFVQSNDGRQARAAEMYKGGLKTSQMVRQADLKHMLNELDAIRSVQFDLSVVSEQTRTPYRPLDEFVEHTRWAMKVKTSVQGKRALKKLVLDAVDEMAPTDGQIVGTQDGIKRTIDLWRNPSNFGEFDYDEHFAPRAWRLILRKFDTAPFMKTMIEVMKESVQLFAAEERP